MTENSHADTSPDQKGPRVIPAGAIDPERLRHIPEAYHAQHEFCFRIHDLMVDVLRQAEAYRIADVKITFGTDAESQALKDAPDKLAHLVATGHADVAKTIVINQTVIPLYGDMLHFIYEALSALERRKYTVAFSLLRKPLKYDLLFATWLWADEADFFKCMQDPAHHMDDSRISKGRRLELLEQAIAAIGEPHFLDARVIYEIVFERKNKGGLAPYFDMANHLVTSYSAIRTDMLNLNFIFKSPADTDIYEGIYYPLAYVLVYLFLIELNSFGRMTLAAPSYLMWASWVILGTFEALFSDDETPALDEANAVFGPLLRCRVCNAQMTVERSHAPRFYLAEELDCRRCGQSQQFPLFWVIQRMHPRGETVEQAGC